MKMKIVQVLAHICRTNLDAFYVKFWSLQKYLKNPVVLHSQAVLDEFKPKLDFVINKFYAIEQERMKLRGQAVNNKSTEQKMDVILGSEEKSEFYPGFLKSRQLFDLQVTFRPHNPTNKRWLIPNSAEQYYSKSW
jgi:THO complex subunit 1 transcription elongation factor